MPAIAPAPGASCPASSSRTGSVLSVSIGPLALPVSPLLLLAAVWIGSALTGGLARRAGSAGNADAAAALDDGARAGRIVFHAALVGLLAARVAHLALHADAYLGEPWAVLDLRDGGWQPHAGLLAGAAWLFWQAARHPRWRGALAAGALAGAGAWALGAWATGRFDAPVLPALALHDVDRARTTTLTQVAAGRPLVVNLWASWCGPCRQEMPMLAQAQQQQPHITFAFVNQGEPAEVVRRYLAGSGLALREVLLDPTSSLGTAVASRGLPTTLFYDAQGRQVDAHFGVLNAAALAARTSRWRTLAKVAAPVASTVQPHAGDSGQRAGTP
ncbi:MAG: TlpA family protein disulfide reductase [Rubrivivax sp.]|nr:TlpA family protein disulfide reductase [Rubrivivax sp.]